MPVPVVCFERVSKRFRKNAGSESMFELIGLIARRFLRRKNMDSSDQTFWALRDLDFHVHAGEAIGLIGPNGAGKSTALKLLARILRPDSGHIRVRGRLTALIEVGAGFHSELTGRENIFLNGAILGMSRPEIRRKLDEIVAFAGVESFLDMPVKRYSSGMYARLGFSIAAHVDPDVLLVDEVLSVGDAVFRLRCLERMKSLIRNGTALVFVTHQLEQMQAVCDRALVLDRGCCTFQGRAGEVIDHYFRAMTETHSQRPTDFTTGSGSGLAACEVRGFRLLDARGHETVCFRSCGSLRLDMELLLRRSVSRLVLELNLRGAAHEHLLSINSARFDQTFDADEGEHSFTLTMPALPLAGGQYFWNLRAWDADTGETLLDTPFRYPMILDDGGRGTGALCLEHDWRHTTRARTAPAEPASGESHDRPVCPTLREVIPT